MSGLVWFPSPRPADLVGGKNLNLDLQARAFECCTGAVSFGGADASGRRHIRGISPGAFERVQ